MKKFKIVLCLCAVLVLVGCKEQKMGITESYNSDQMKGIISYPNSEADSLMVLLHGVGASESGLVEVGKMLAPDSIVLSLRAPITLQANSYAWFHVQFTSNGPVHNWSEAKSSLDILEKELKQISEKLDIPLSKISVMGFSQGSIMTMGLLLSSKLELESYLCFSGRTLPEFADYAAKNPQVSKDRKVFLTHGVHDDKLPISLAQTSKDILIKTKANMNYLEFQGGHTIMKEVVDQASSWLSGDGS